MFVLDVGCGNYPRGHVNVDAYTEATYHRSSDWRPINTEGLIFVKASGEALPFKDNTFDLVFSNAVMEHVNNPTLFLKECYRVSKNVVKIRVPHRFARERLKFYQGRMHINFFNLTYFRKLLRGYAFNVEGRFHAKPHRLLPIFLWPSRITVTIYKQTRKLSYDKYARDMPK